MGAKKWNMPYLGYIYEGTNTELEALTPFAKTGDLGIDMTNKRVQVYSSAYTNFGLGNGNGLTSKGLARSVYDFSVDGATSSDLKFGATLPAYSAVTNFTYYVDTTFTSTSSANEISIQYNGSSLSSGHIIVSSSTLGFKTDVFYTGLLDGYTASKFAQGTSSAGRLNVHFVGSSSGHAITAGKLVAFAEYVIFK